MPTGRHALCRGFTLIEIIVVMVIAVMMLGVVGPRVASGIGAVRFRSAAQDIASALRLTRAKAIAERRQTALTVFLEEHRYLVAGNKAYDIPEDVEIGLYTAADQTVNDNQGDIRFYPDGSATGGRITLTYRGQQRQIDINWLTGMVEILESHE